MITLAAILGAVQDFALAGLVLTLVLMAGKGCIGRLVTWLARKARGEFASPSSAHPASRAVRGWERISGAEDREFEQIAERLRGELPADAKFPAPRGEK